MIVNTESITVSRNGKVPIPLYAAITTHCETRMRPVQAWVNGEFQTNWSLYIQLSFQPSNKCLRFRLHKSGYFLNHIYIFTWIGSSVHTNSVEFSWEWLNTQSTRIRVKQIYRFKNVWIRVNEALVIRNAGTVYCTISASQWYIIAA